MCGVLTQQTSPSPYTTTHLSLILAESDHRVASTRHLLRRSGASREQAAHTRGREARGGTESDHRVTSTRHLPMRFGASREQAAHTRSRHTRGGTESDNRVASTRHLPMRSATSRLTAPSVGGLLPRGPRRLLGASGYTVCRCLNAHQICRPENYTKL